MRKTLIYKFDKELQAYSIHYFGVNANDGGISTAFSVNCFSFIPFVEIFGGAYDQDYLVGELYIRLRIFSFTHIFTLSFIYFSLIP